MKKVILIIVDGMRGECLSNEKCKTWNKIKAFGTYSDRAVTTYPPITLPCHMSLFYSVGSDKHKILDNQFKKNETDSKGLIEVLASNGKKSAVYYSWEQLRDLWEPGDGVSSSSFISYKYNQNDFDVDRALGNEFIRNCNRDTIDFHFLYLGASDEIGHKYGWMSDEYLNAIENAAQIIYEIITKVSDKYTIIVTADHGGHGKNHGDNICEDMMIPLIMIGEEYQKNKESVNEYSILDVAPTIARMFELEGDINWEGKIIPECVEKKS